MGLMTLAKAAWGWGAERRERTGAGPWESAVGNETGTDRNNCAIFQLFEHLISQLYQHFLLFSLGGF